MTPPATPCAETGLSVRTRLIALVVAVTFFIENLGATVIATALPTMAKAFGVTPVDMNIGITAYILAVAIFIPLSSWVADRFGARRVFAGAIIVFTLASLLCGLSQSLEMFVLARVLQGIGGALMVPVGRLAVLRNTDKKDLVKMIAIITWPGLVAPILGPFAGGLIVGGLSRSMQFTGYNSIGFADVPKARMSEASALFSLSFQLAMGMGVTVAALLLRASMMLKRARGTRTGWRFSRGVCRGSAARGFGAGGHLPIAGGRGRKRAEPRVSTGLKVSTRCADLRRWC